MHSQGGGGCLESRCAAAGHGLQYNVCQCHGSGFQGDRVHLQPDEPGGLPADDHLAATCGQSSLNLQDAALA